MARNIKYQFKSAIDRCFKPGTDKHSAKVQGKLGQDTIFSYSDRRDLIDTSASFCNYMCEHHADIKFLRDIESSHVQEFLACKAKSCSQETLKQYQARFTKLEKIANKSFNLDLDYSKQVYVPTSEKNGGKVRNIDMQQQHYKALIKSCSESDSRAVNAIYLARTVGSRVSEATKLQGQDIDLQKGTVHLIGKGGRERYVPITEENRSILEQIKAGVQDRERVVPLRSDSVNRFLSRQLIKLGIEDYANAKTGIHSIRKMYAQETFDKCRLEGLTINQALSQTSILLGHGENRNVLMREYVLDIK